MHIDSSSVEEWQEVRRTPETEELIFIGGHESTGTGLMRVMLDAHPLIRCGAEPMVTLEILNMRHSIKGVRRQRAIKAGVYPEAYDQAVASFILKVVERMGSPAPYLCHKQPLTFNYLGYLGYLFPKAKFIHMIRDGRAVVASSISRGLGPKFGRDQQHEALKRWERIVIPILRDCQDIGKARCITIRYEKLVLQTEDETRKLFAFLGIPWDPVVLQHEVVLSNLTSLNP
ncbi:protein-tyrosine sulfotransferase [Paragonimus westermani]|uniref:Protein-tyrosine sulfotransferase n=1 Tax=Paragonimus westermani TaxID=34504 RepID=A0A5J4NU43_9TREM|nr:protein-tyrosine sulfotransferase [Paragonimus westermani]